MSTFAIEPLRGDAWVRCKGAGQGKRRSCHRKAGKRAVFMQTYYAPYTVALCRPCAQEWARIWDDALAGSASR